MKKAGALHCPDGHLITSIIVDIYPGLSDTKGYNCKTCASFYPYTMVSTEGEKNLNSVKIALPNLDDSEIQIVVMALAQLSNRRPGWSTTLLDVAGKIHPDNSGINRMFAEFKELDDFNDNSINLMDELSKI